MGVSRANAPESTANDSRRTLKTNSRKRNLAWAKTGVIGSILAILIITALEFPPPVGFETRPQNDVSSIWLVFFLVILVTEIAAIPLIYKRANLGVAFGIAAAALNILQVIADQAHLMQPEVAPLGYSILEWLAVIASLALIYFAWRVRGLAQETAA
ncbi:MAG: hypothetical protein M1319_00990 [Chloroflexi bacterium]|nr:hypothetical protein [Chloroflexota bacterium]